MGDSYHYEDGAIHNDHKKVLHIDKLQGADLQQVMRGFFNDNAEDAEIVEEVKATDDIVKAEYTPAPQQTNEQPRDNTSSLSNSRQAILDRLLDLADKGEWVRGITAEDIKTMLKTVLGQGETSLPEREAKVSETLWHLLEHGRGDRMKIVWQNLIGYFVDRKLLPSTMGAPALNKMFFGDKTGYTNIDKGRPSKGLMTADLESLLPLLDAYVPKVGQKT